MNIAYLYLFDIQNIFRSNTFVSIYTHNVLNYFNFSKLKNTYFICNLESFFVNYPKYIDPNKSTKSVKNKSNSFRYFYLDKRCNLIGYITPLNTSKELLSCLTNKLVKLTSLDFKIKENIIFVTYKVTKIKSISCQMYLEVLREVNSS